MASINRWLPTMSIAIRLLKLRKQHQLSQQALAEFTGIHVQQIKRYEAGSAQPSIDALKKLATAFHVSTDALLFDPDERGPDDELRFQFEALSELSAEEKKIAKAVIDGLLLRHHAQRLSGLREAS